MRNNIRYKQYYTQNSHKDYSNNNSNNKNESNNNINDNNNKKSLNINTDETNNMPYNDFRNNTSTNFHKKKIDFNNNINHQYTTDYSNYKNNDNIYDNLNKNKIDNENKNTDLNNINEKKQILRTKSESDLLNPDINRFLNNKYFFNSSLIILSNINYIYEFFNNDKNNNKINEMHRNNKNCLNTILYFIIKNKIKSNIGLEDLYKKHPFFSWVKNKNSNYENKLDDINNLKDTIVSIYRKIDNELLTKNDKNSNDNYNILKKNFTFIYQLENKCGCEKINRTERRVYTMFYNIIKYLGGRIRNLNKVCALCKNKIKEIYTPKSLPNILTIFIPDQLKNTHNIEDKIKINNDIYILISFLCSDINTKKLISYFININDDGLWYINSDEMNGKTEKMNSNIIPLMLIYQKENEFPFKNNYNNLQKTIKKVENKINNQDKYIYQSTPIQSAEYSRIIKIPNVQEKDNVDLLQNYKNQIIDLEKKLKEEENKHIKEKSEYEKEKSELEKEKNEMIIEMNLQKQKNDEMNKKINLLEEENSSLKKDNSSLKAKIKRFPLILNKNERMISLILCSCDEVIMFPIICKNKDNISKIREILLKKYPEYKNKKIEFIKNGITINNNDNLINNKIYDESIIIFKIQ